MAAVKKIAVTALLLIVPLSWAVPPGTSDEIAERLKPVGSVCRAGEECGTATAAVATGPMSGEQVYNQFCFACHAAGVSGAPLFKDPDQWAPRVAKGMEAMMQTSLNGLNAMPAKGTCMTCSDEEIQAAIEHMLP